MKFAVFFIIFIMDILNVFSSESDAIVDIHILTKTTKLDTDYERVANGSTSADDSEVSDRDKRLIGGSWAKYNQFRYYVSVLVNGRFRCGGSLIDKSHVLTAAHCLHEESTFFDAFQIQILIDHNFLFDERPAKISVEVEKVFVPRAFTKTVAGFLVGDIAVLKLKNHPEISSAWLINLPKNNGSLAGKEVIATGQGVNSVKFRSSLDHKTGSFDEVDGHLRFAKFIVISDKDCSKAWGHDIPKNLICAKRDYRRGSSKGSLCRGDSGGPLAHGKTIVGVLSTGTAMCQSNIPEVFTRVSSYNYFIHKSIHDIKDPNIKMYNLKNYFNYN